MKEPGIAAAARKTADGARGQALVELALIAPFVLLLVVLVVDFAGLIGAWIQVANAARAAADYAALGSSSAGSPTPATPTDLQHVITADLADLPGSSTNTNVCIRQNINNGASYNTIMQMGSSGCANYPFPPSDGEVMPPGTTQYTNLAVDITYTYAPFIAGSSFLGYFLPNIPTSVHQRAVMRVLQ